MEASQQPFNALELIKHYRSQEPQGLRRPLQRGGGVGALGGGGGASFGGGSPGARVSGRSVFAPATREVDAADESAARGLGGHRAASPMAAAAGAPGLASATPDPTLAPTPDLTARRRDDFDGDDDEDEYDDEHHHEHDDPRAARGANGHAESAANGRAAAREDDGNGFHGARATPTAATASATADAAYARKLEEQLARLESQLDVAHGGSSGTRSREERLETAARDERRAHDEKVAQRLAASTRQLLLRG